MGCSGCYNKVETFLGSVFRKYGRFVARHPWLFIIGSAIISGCLGIGFIRLEQENDVEAAYVPKDNQASKDRSYLYYVYPDVTSYDFSTRTLPGLGLHGEIIAGRKDGLNVLNLTSLEDLRVIHEAILNVSIAVGDSLFYFDDICAIRNNQCVISGEFVFTSSFKNDLATNAVSYPLYQHATFGQLSLAFVFGGVKTAASQLSSAKYIRLRYHLRQDDSVESATEGWMDAFKDHMTSVSSDTLDFAYSHSYSLEEELDKNTTGDIVFITLTFVVMIAYATLAISGGNCITNRGFLSYAGVLSTGLAILGSIGFVSICGVKFVNIVAVMPFLVLGIGVDDMFILLSGLAEVQHLDSVEDKIGETLRSAGLAITITSLTDLLAFCVGSISVFMSVKNFCIYTGVAVIFCYLNQVTFFTGCMTLHERRIQASRHSITCMVTQPRNEMKEQNKSKISISCCSGPKPKSRDEVEGTLEKYPRKFILRILRYPSVRILILFMFIVYLGFAIWGAVNTKQGLLLQNIVADDSYYYKYESLNAYFSKEHFVSFVFKENVEYWNPAVREKINTLIASAQSDVLINDHFSMSWIQYFSSSSVFNDSSELSFMTTLQLFLQNAPGHTSDLVINDNKIISSRVYVLTEDLSTTDQQGDVLLRTRDLAARSGLSVFAYAAPFIFYEQYVLILSSTLQTVGIALAAVVVATFMFMPHPLLMFYVILTVVMIVVGLFGFMYFWGLTLSSITMILLIMSVGFAIDYSVHTCHAYMQADSPTRFGRMNVAIDMAAAPILNAALSSFVGILMLLLSKSYIFQTFFKVMFLVIVLGFSHSTLFLPSLLSFVGPTGKRKTSQNGEMKRDASLRDERRHSPEKVVPVDDDARPPYPFKNVDSNSVHSLDLPSPKKWKQKIPKPLLYKPSESVTGGDQNEHL